MPDPITIRWSPGSPDEAAELARIKALLPMSLRSREYAYLPAAIKQRAVFSAAVANARILQAIKDQVEGMVTGQIGLAEGRLALQKLLGAGPETGDEPITDLTSRARLDLILKTQTQLAQGFAQHIQSNQPGAIDAFPAQELYRLEDRSKPRDWEARWRFAASASGDGNALRMLLDHGRMIARKDSPIWAELGSTRNFDDALDVDYPPFAFNSGMWVRDIDRDESLALGLIAPDTVIEPKPPPDFNAAVQASIADLDPDIRALLKSGLGDAVEFDKDTVRLKSQGELERIASEPFVRLNTPADAERFANEELIKSWERLTHAEKDSTETYQGAGHLPINAALRADKPLPDTVKSAAEHLDKAIEKRLLPRNLIVYRQSDFPVSEIGQTFTDPGFVSSSLLPEIAAQRPGNVFATIRVTAGTPAIYLGEPGRGVPGYEHEILLRRNTRFRVLSKTMRGSKLFVELEVIP